MLQKGTRSGRYTLRSDRPSRTTASKIDSTGVNPDFDSDIVGNAMQMDTSGQTSEACCFMHPAAYGSIKGKSHMEIRTLLGHYGEDDQKEKRAAKSRRNKDRHRASTKRKKETWWRQDHRQGGAPPATTSQVTQMLWRFRTQPARSPAERRMLNPAEGLSPTYDRGWWATQEAVAPAEVQTQRSQHPVTLPLDASPEPSTLPAQQSWGQELLSVPTETPDTLRDTFDALQRAQSLVVGGAFARIEAEYASPTPRENPSSSVERPQSLADLREADFIGIDHTITHEEECRREIAALQADAKSLQQGLGRHSIASGPWAGEMAEQGPVGSTITAMQQRFRHALPTSPEERSIAAFRKSFWWEEVHTQREQARARQEVEAEARTRADLLHSLSLAIEARAAEVAASTEEPEAESMEATDPKEDATRAQREQLHRMSLEDLVVHITSLPIADRAGTFAALPSRMADYVKMLIEASPAAEAGRRMHMMSIAAMAEEMAAMTPEDKQRFLAGLNTRLGSYVSGLVEGGMRQSNEDDCSEFPVQVEEQAIEGMNSGAEIFYETPS